MVLYSSVMTRLFPIDNTMRAHCNSHFAHCGVVYHELLLLSEKFSRKNSKGLFVRVKPRDASSRVSKSATMAISLPTWHNCLILF